MKAAFKNHWVIIDPDGDIMFNTISEHQIVTETCLQVHTNWDAETSKRHGFILANVNIKFTPHK